MHSPMHSGIDHGVTDGALPALPDSRAESDTDTQL